MSERIKLVSSDGRSTATVSLWGARLLSWRCANRERIFMPASAAQDERSAPHGGVPVLFPQFGFFGPGRKHGVVRDIDWQIESQSDNFVILKNVLVRAEHVPASEVRLRVDIESDAICMQFSVTNIGDEVMRFTCGLHTYLRVDDISEVRLSGLEKTAWQDALANLQMRVASNAPLDAPINVDRVYVDAPLKLNLTAGNERITLEQTGFKDTVVWNPGPALAADLKDLSNDEWRQFLCVEAAQIAKPVELEPQATWQATQRLQMTAS